MTESATPEVRQEGQDIRGKPIALIGAAVVLIGSIAVGAEALMLESRRGSMRDRTAVPILAPGTSASPIEHTRIEQVARGLAARERALEKLESYGWVDEDEGMIRIPIEAAMRWVAQEEAARRRSDAGAVPTAPDREPDGGPR